MTEQPTRYDVVKGRLSSLECVYVKLRIEGEKNEDDD
jgi:hypothetical protein